MGKVLAPEYAKNAAETEIECVCRNTADSSGFGMCLPDGTLVGPSIGDTPNEHVVCFHCLRVILSANGLVTGRAVLGPDGQMPCKHEDVWPGKNGKPDWCQSCGRDL